MTLTLYKNSSSNNNRNKQQASVSKKWQNYTATKYNYGTSDNDVGRITIAYILSLTHTHRLPYMNAVTQNQNCKTNYAYTFGAVAQGLIVIEQNYYTFSFRSRSCLSFATDKFVTPERVIY